MGTASIHEGARMVSFSTLLDRHERGELNQAEAAEILGMSVRSFQRWRDRYDADGEAGLADGRMGRPSPKRAPEAEIERMLGLYRDRYDDFTVKHFHQKLKKYHGYKLGYTVTKLSLHRAGLVARAPKRSAHRKKRPRRPMRGMMLHQDGSRHVWLEGQPAMDLIVTLDDATGEIYSMFLVPEEGTASTFRALREVIGKKGVFCALYTDRGSHYFHTPEAGGPVSKTRLTQVGQALRDLSIEHIGAYSPQARGRSERTFGTLQGRLPKEFRLAGIETVEEANAWLAEHYIGEYNAEFPVRPDDEGSAFVVDATGRWRDILCVREERVVGNDNNVQWNGKSLQLPESRLRPHFVKASVRVNEYPDGTVSVFLGPHRLADYDARGAQIVPDARQHGAVLAPVKDKPSRARKCASLTAAARDATRQARAGTKKRAASRTKKQASAPTRHTRRPAA